MVTAAIPTQEQASQARTAWPARLRQREKLYYTADGLGSVRTLSDTSGTLKNKYDFEAFGSPYSAGTSETVDNRYTFTSQEAPTFSGGPMYYNYRHYDTAIGRFGGRDPIGYAPNFALHMDSESSPAYQVGLLHSGAFINAWEVPPALEYLSADPLTDYGLIDSSLYVYSANNPANFIDVYGKAPCKVRTETQFAAESDAAFLKRVVKGLTVPSGLFRQRQVTPPLAPHSDIRVTKILASYSADICEDDGCSAYGRQCIWRRFMNQWGVGGPKFWDYECLCVCPTLADRIRLHR